MCRRPHLTVGSESESFRRDRTTGKKDASMSERNLNS